MNPAPARIASTPTHSSRTCWNPAVPPPPVAGAAVGNELADGLGDGLGLGLGVAVPGVAAGDVAAGGVVAGGVAVPGALAPGVALAETAGVAGPVPGENVGGVAGPEPDEHPDTDAAANTAQAAQPSTVPSRRRRPGRQGQRSLQAGNGLFIAVISGYAGRTP
jgi:hypothetical protein